MPLSSNQLKEIIAGTGNESLRKFENVLLYNMQIGDNEGAIIIATNSLLSNAKTRVKGLEIVNLIISHCSFNALSEHSINWASHCIVHHATDNTKEIKLRTLARIIENTADIDTFNKKFLTECLSDTLKACLNSQNSAENIAALICLGSCMKRYSSWFGNHKHKVEPFLLKFLESSVKDETKYAAIAFHYLQQTGGAGIDGINYIENYSTQFKKLLSTVHVLYDSFLESLNEIDTVEKIEVEPFTFRALPPNFDSIKVLEATATKIINSLTFIKIMIIKQFSVAKQIVPKHVIDIVNRGLSLHICLDAAQISMESNCLSLLLNKVQVELFQLLRAFLVGHVSSILPFTYILTKLLLNALKRTQNCTCFTTDERYIKYTYKTLLDWLILTRSGSQLHLQETLIPLLLKDASPVKKKVLLNLNFTSRTKGKSKHKQTVNTVNTTDEKTLYVIDTKLREKKCIFALDVLRIVFETSHLKLQQSVLQELSLFVVKTLGDIHSGRTVSPYFNAECQVKLYEVLIAFFKQEKITFLPPIHLVINILNEGLKLGRPNISSVCQMGLDFLEKICQPVCPSLHIHDSEATIREKVIINNTELDMLNIQDINEENEIKEIEDILLDKFDKVEEHFVQDEIQLQNVKPPEKLINIVSDIKIQSANITMENGPAESTIDLDTDSSSSVIDVLIIANEDKPLRKRIDDIEEPPEKRKKENHNGDADDMLNSFQDVVQDYSYAI